MHSCVNARNHLPFLAAYLIKAIIAKAMRHKNSAKPPVIKPIRVFVNHPSLVAFLLPFSTGSCPSLGNRVEILYSVVSSSVAGTDDSTGEEIRYSVVFNWVKGADDGEDVLSGG